MKLDEADVISFPRKLVEHTILGLQPPLNRHLVQLVGSDLPSDLRDRFKKEVDNWLFETQALRFKPHNRTGSFKFYFDLLFDYPFGGVEIENMSKMMDFISREYGGVRRTRTAAEMVEWLLRFHTELAERLHDGEDVLDLIPA